jgi:hypothetical protein
MQSHLLLLQSCSLRIGQVNPIQVVENLMNSLIQVVENEFNLPDFVFHFTLAVLQVFDEGGKALNSSKTIETFPKPTVKKINILFVTNAVSKLA